MASLRPCKSIQKSTIFARKESCCSCGNLNLSHTILACFLFHCTPHFFPQAWSVRTAGPVQSSSEGPQFAWSGCTRASKRAWYWTEKIFVTHAEIWTSLCAISSCLLWTVFMILWSGPVLKDLSFLSPIAHYCKSIRKKVVAHAAIWTSLIRTIQQFLSKKSNLIQKQGRACRAVTGFHTLITVADIKAIWLMSLRFEHKWPLENQCPWRTLGKPIP